AAEELKAAFQVRLAVFVQEQGVPEECEIDEHEGEAEHIILCEANQVIGTARVRYFGCLAKMERICVLPQFRKLRAGVMLLEGLENLARAKGMTKAKLHGQKQAENFYHKQGYRTSSEIFMEDGIPHLLMLKTL
ncbi:MAG: GNAT family N-acetyltransferase, partial [Acidaminococcaceae bacterium]